jgi:alcohol dehydrogenase (cytochrome c)
MQVSPSLPGPSAIFTYQLANKQYLAVLSGSVSAFFGGGKETTKITVLAPL